MNDDRLRDLLDLDAWEPPDPPADFVSCVVTEAQRNRPRRAVWAGGVAALAAVAAAAWLLLAHRAPATGELVAQSRTTTHLGGRAVVVAEQGAHLAWRADVVAQDRGDAFYRVEPGGAFKVTTPAGDVDVRGTCFRVKVGSEMTRRDVKVGAAGAAATAVAFVVVYEGSVAVARGAQSVALGAGEAAQLDANGVQRAVDPEAARAAFDKRVAGDDDPLLAANQSLAESVRTLQSRLDVLDEERAGLGKRLDEAHASLADAGAFNPNRAFDLSKEDWKELAAKGKVKFRTPACLSPRGWSPDREELNALGLAPDDGRVIKDAYARAYEREWSELRPICAQVFSPEVADKLGPGQCSGAVVHVLGDNNWKRVQAAITEVAEVRAGLRPLPDSPDDPVERVFLVWTGALGDLESDLARSFGPEEAHRVVFSHDMCAYNDTW
jgi:hypothetical protein